MRTTYTTALLASSLLALWSCGGDKSSSPEPVARAAMTFDCGAPSSCVPANSAMIEVTCPQKGDTLVPGDTVVMRWRANVGPGDFSSFIPWNKATGDSTYKSLAETSIPIGSSTDDNQCYSYSTVLPVDFAVGYASFRVTDYSPNIANLRSVVDSVLIVAP